MESLIQRLDKNTNSHWETIEEILKSIDNTKQQRRELRKSPRTRRNRPVQKNPCHRTHRKPNRQIIYPLNANHKKIIKKTKTISQAIPEEKVGCISIIKIPLQPITYWTYITLKHIKQWKQLKTQSQPANYLPNKKYNNFPGQSLNDFIIRCFHLAFYIS